MSIQITSLRRSPLLFLLPLLLLFAWSSCGSKSGADRPQQGRWKAEFSIKSDGGRDYNWVIDFRVSEDGKKASGIQALHYRGELKSDTQATVLFSGDAPSIRKNSFAFSFSELTGYSSHTYKGKTKFTSATKAEGTLDIEGTEYKWTAAPVSE